MFIQCDGVAVLQRCSNGRLRSWSWTGISEHNYQVSTIIF